MIGINGLEPARRLRRSDADLLETLAAAITTTPAPPLTPDLVYTAFLEAKKARDAWLKASLIGVALLFLVAAEATSELALLGAKFKAEFIAPAAIVYLAVCMIGRTGPSLRVRLYTAFFRQLRRAAPWPEHGALLLRYPMAYSELEFLPHKMTPPGSKPGLSQILGLVPQLAALAMVILALCASGLYLLLEAFVTMWLSDLPRFIKITVAALSLGAIILNGLILRAPEKKRAMAHS